MIGSVQLKLQISQLRDQLNSRSAERFDASNFIQVLERCAREMVYDEPCQVIYLYDVICYDMLFKQINVYYATDQIVFAYSALGPDMGSKIIARLQQENISFHPVQKSFILS